MAIHLSSSEKLSIDLKSFGFDKPRNKWQGKINFQTIFILEQQVLLFHFKFLEVQTSEISHRKCMDEGNFFFCVWKSTHVILQLPILLLSTHIYPKF